MYGFDPHGSVLAVAMLVLGIASVSLLDVTAGNNSTVSLLLSPTVMIGTSVGAYAVFVFLIVRRRR